MKITSLNTKYYLRKHYSISFYNHIEYQILVISAGLGDSQSGWYVDHSHMWCCFNSRLILGMACTVLCALWFWEWNLTSLFLNQIPPHWSYSIATAEVFAGMTYLNWEDWCNLNHGKAQMQWCSLSFCNDKSYIYIYKYHVAKWTTRCSLTCANKYHSSRNWSLKSHINACPSVMVIKNLFETHHKNTTR